jgi:hypothetical protein
LELLVNDKITELEQRRDTMIAYARMKLDSHDWHGVRDAMVDIEIIEANLLYLKVYEKESVKGLIS